MSSSRVVLVAMMVVASVFSQGVKDSKDNIGFPEVYGDDSLRPANNEDGREPLYMPVACPENEILYPGDQAGVWSCDCRATYIYHPEDEKCYATYEQGPCNAGDILILPPGKVIPVCVPNVCYNTGQVLLAHQPGKRRSCVTLGQPCDPNTQWVYGVNATSLKVECLSPPKQKNQPPPRDAPVIHENLATRFQGDEITPATPSLDKIKGARPSSVLVATAIDNECTPGCKRAQNNQCPPETKYR